MPKKSTSSKSESPSFERAMQELESIVEQMEQGDISLDQSLQKFERGIELTRICQKALKDAEQKVQILTGKDGHYDSQPFAEDNENQ
ncbi:MAG: exodeoxyribonuclease VII small subunit [Gammaproteobacteria bacterium]